MEQTDTVITRKPIIPIGFNQKELGVFLLLLFLNLKFAAITIVQSRSVAIDAIVYLLFIFTFNYSNWTYKSLIKMTIFIGIYTLINFSSYKLNVLMPLIIIQCVSGISYTKYLKITFIITGITLLLMYMIYGEGLNMSGFSFIIDRKTRMTFGFGHPNSAALYYYCLIINGLLLLYFSKYKKYILYFMVLIIPLWFYIYGKTASRSFILSIFVLYISYIYYYFVEKYNYKVLYKLAGYVCVLLLFLFTAITLYFSTTRLDNKFLDRVLSKRLTYYNIFLEKVNTLDFLFGSDAYKDLVIDSSYLHLLFEGGILFLLGFVFFMCFQRSK